MPNIPAIWPVILTVLLVGTTKYGAFLLSPLNGRPIDGFDLGSGFSQTPAGYGSKAFLLTNGGTFLGLEIDAPNGPSHGE